MKNRILVGWCCFLLASLSLSACSHRVVQPPPMCSPAGLTYLQNELDGLGGQFVELGDEVMVTLPTYQVFLGSSRNMTPVAGVLFGQVAERLNCYPTQAVSVTVYVGTLCRSDANVALADQRAQLVSGVLQSYGVSRLVYERARSLHGVGADCTQNRIELLSRKVAVS